MNMDYFIVFVLGAVVGWLIRENKARELEALKVEQGKFVAKL